MPLSKIETQQMVIAGPYKYMRHPMILSVIFILVSEALILGSLSILIWAIIFFVGNLFYLPFSEEKGLEKRFGDEFRDYKANVRGWIPRITPYEKSNPQ